MREITKADWEAEAIGHYGPDQMNWEFRCPVCGYVAKVSEWKAVGAPEGAVAFSCVGRWKRDARDVFRGSGPGPCNYTGGGLFRLNPVKITFPDGTTWLAFEFGAVPEDKKETKTT